ncbi:MULTISPECIES: hypothetical protein [unclassified Paenibacillus]|uniref:hypothetical protein n=1 Tax=unclassified Paenibacillus TaxID=185978 RepID=UPI0003FA8ACB|nr:MULTISPECIES: hypothetical protein [unclassified Paenibacillus]KGP80103.1 hypothetical protein P364_0122145 [Paenibacillus sp. MAEPY2]KGP89396.1 hypothetical protein P363_0100145 [Paenibacillus sp. MAEPY1]
MGHYFYITPGEYEEAAKLGISPAMLDRRVRAQGWPKQRAMTTPPRPLTDRRRWKAEAENNGISYDTFMSRINRGWTMERAATEPLQTPEQAKAQTARATEAIRIYPKEYVELAAQNGIAYATFVHRVKGMGWDYDRAATEPLRSHQQSGVLGAKRLREREGDWAAQIFGKR